MRKKNHQIVVRMDDGEYRKFLEDVKASGLSQQAYLSNAVHSSTLPDPVWQETLVSVSRAMNGIQTNLRAIGTNINQIARKTNGTGYLSVGAYRELQEQFRIITEYRKEVEDVWQSVRSSITMLNRLLH